MSDDGSSQKNPYGKRREPNYELMLPLLYAPVRLAATTCNTTVFWRPSMLTIMIEYVVVMQVLPLIRVGLRGRLPQKQIDIIFGAAVLTALGHAGIIMSRDSSV